MAKVITTGFLAENKALIFKGKVINENQIIDDVSFFIDTGCYKTFISKSFLDRFNINLIKKNSLKSRDINGSVFENDFYSTNINISIGGALMKLGNVGLVITPTITYDILLGTEFLEREDLIIKLNFKNKRFIMIIK